MGLISRVSSRAYRDISQNKNKMMKLAVIALLGFSASAYAACEVGLWGVNCNNVCVGCDDTGCDVEGKCTTGTCVDGFQAVDGICQASCFGGLGGCAEGGECVAPNYCICGKSGAQVVGVQGTYLNSANAKLEEGVNCVSLRKDGIKGAFIALAVMIISIGSCGFIEVQRNKGKSKKD